MAFVLADRVLETSTSTGTGSFVLAGARDGYQSFTDALANGDTTYYTITDGTDWEVGLGTWTESTATLARTTVLSSSNSGSAVNFGAGTKDVFISYPSSKFAEDTTAALLKSGGTLTGSLTTGSGITLNGAQTGGYPTFALQSSSGSTSYILMGTSADPDEGAIEYRPAQDTMTFRTGTNYGLQITDLAYVKVYGNATNGSGAIQLNCENNSHGVKIKGPPHSAAANYTLTLPDDDGTNGQALTTDGSGGLSWTTITSGSTLTIKDEGSALATAATTLNFTGAGVTATGSGAEKTITISGGGGSGGSGVAEGKALVFANLFG